MGTKPGGRARCEKKGRFGRGLAEAEGAQGKIARQIARKRPIVSTEVRKIRLYSNGPCLLAARVRLDRFGGRGVQTQKQLLADFFHLGMIVGERPRQGGQGVVVELHGLLGMAA